MFDELVGRELEVRPDPLLLLFVGLPVEAAPRRAPGGAQRVTTGSPLLQTLDAASPVGWTAITAAFTAAPSPVVAW